MTPLPSHEQELRALAERRMLSTRLWGTPFATPEQTVGWLTAVQAQDYGAAKWAVALRTKSCRDSDVESALQDGRILRTHVLRPTWHFVLPADIRWLLALSAPRVRRLLALGDRKLGISGAVLTRSQAIFQKALAGGKQRTRNQLASALHDAGLPFEGQALAHLMMHAELSALLCSGARHGKQFSYALLEERVPERGPTYTRERALATLAERYFESHGPALADDFAWWSGLTLTDARAAISAAEGLEAEELNGKQLWSLRSGSPRRKPARPAVELLPNFDEHVIAYRDHNATFVVPAGEKTLASERGRVGHFLLLDGRIVGRWRRTLEQGQVVVAVEPHSRLDPAQRLALEKSATRYGKFLGATVLVRVGAE